MAVLQAVREGVNQTYRDDYSQTWCGSDASVAAPRFQSYSISDGIKRGLQQSLFAGQACCSGQPSDCWHCARGSPAVMRFLARLVGFRWVLRDTR